MGNHPIAIPNSFKQLGSESEIYGRYFLHGSWPVGEARQVRTLNHIHLISLLLKKILQTQPLIRVCDSFLGFASYNVHESFKIHHQTLCFWAGHLRCPTHYFSQPLRKGRGCKLQKLKKRSSSNTPPKTDGCLLKRRPF